MLPRWLLRTLVKVAVTALVTELVRWVLKTLLD